MAKLPAPLITYPQGPMTPHGIYHVMNGIHPEVVLKAYDNSIHFNVMGGRSIADRVMLPEVVQLIQLSGLIAPWRHIDQKGATQDGITQIDALYDPIEIEFGVMCRGRNAVYTRRVVDDLIASIDAIRQSELGFLTRDRGYWWSDIRWFKGAPTDTLVGAQGRRQQLSLRLRADDAFWRTYPVTQEVKPPGQWTPIRNIGDQSMYLDIVCFGPGTFTFTDGPQATWLADRDSVVVGPLLENQVALVRTDPRVRGLYDLTTVAPPQQQYNQFQQLLANFLTTAAAGNLPPLLAAIGSAFGIAPPQGPLYSLLKGRFSDASAIPPKSPGRPADTHLFGVSIEGTTNSKTKAIISGVPLRRYPL